MEYFRIVHAKRISIALTGEGAKLFGGRWNEVGISTVYCAENRSLAILEVLAHVRQMALFPSDRYLLTIEFDSDDIHKLADKEMPDRWKTTADYAQTAHVFRKFCLGKNRLGLLVPSVIVPEEYNLMLNPSHPSFSDVRIVDQVPLQIDSRLL